ncbi:ABC transporter ATP-binding protein [Vineibacter terrae]|uniref:ABC transporter ATP-binding protein n=1 Tax=Vineibacter terrae TaxID=2586908 RepID=A0A5C8PC35_9HYPH|nr:ABC transporter ATP-binding protein [Vineibacter terrae]
MLLQAEGLRVGYGEMMALHGISLQAGAGEIVAVLGANGAGKTTLLRTLSGLLSARAGRISFDGHDVSRRPAHQLVRLGISHVPEGRGVLAELTVIENLQLGAYARGGVRKSGGLDRVFELFPVLAERRDQPAGMLSGGEQQMLAIGRSLLARPKLLMIDELSLGLAPRIVHQLMDLMHTIKTEGLSVLLVEQNVHQTLKVADRVYLLVNGHIAFQGTPDALRAEGDLMRTYLGTD